MLKCMFDSLLGQLVLEVLGALEDHKSRYSHTQKQAGMLFQKMLLIQNLYFAIMCTNQICKSMNDLYHLWPSSFSRFTFGTLQ